MADRKTGKDTAPADAETKQDAPSAEAGKGAPEKVAAEAKVYAQTPYFFTSNWTFSPATPARR